MMTMSESLLRLNFLLLLLLPCVSPSSFFTFNDSVVGLVACGPHQIQAFTEFKNEFDTRACNHNDSLNGVWCDNSTGAVTKLQLTACLSGVLKSNSSLFQFHQLRYLNLSQNNFISSSLPSEFGKLNKLEVLSFFSNGFFGPILSSFSNLSMLSYLDLSSNQFTGSFPFVQNLTKLSILKLYDNHFSGTIPSSLFTMPFLSYLDLRGNNLNGSIDFLNSFSSSKLERLYLGKNHFEGKILEPISKLIDLKELDISYINTSYSIDLSIFSSLKSLLLLDISSNRISQASLSSDSYIPSTLEALLLMNCNISDFPNILKTLPNLESIRISKNKISGKIPEWLWSLPRLRSIFISENSFTGFEGSSEVLVNSSVEILVLDSNNLEGAFPHLPLSINIFSASNNRFKGDIPLSICNRSSLAVLELGHNNFTGPIPPCLSNLMILNLRKNNLEGTIPDKFSSNAPLKILDVGYNQLTGKLPRSLLNCSSLRFLSVDYNEIKDTFPFSLKALPNLQVLILSSNKFYGPMSPPHKGPLGFPELQILKIAGNKFNGSLLPNFFVNWKATSLRMNEDVGLYNAVDLSRNRLEGQIPESIGLLKGLIALNLSNNAFTGNIPLSLANLLNLESLDLSSNQLSGTIPNGLGTLSFLAYINVSHNQLKGEIPHGTQIMGQPKSSFEGNAGLCGFPLEESCFGTNAPPSQQPKDQENKGVAIKYGPGVLLGLAIAQVLAS